METQGTNLAGAVAEKHAAPVSPPAAKSKTTAPSTQVRWNGAKEDPESIVQYGITFKKGEWVAVPVENHQFPNRMRAFENNAYFEVKGHERTPEADVRVEPVVHTETARAPATTFKVQRGASAKGKGTAMVWYVTGKNDARLNEVEYADEATAQSFADAMNLACSK